GGDRRPGEGVLPRPQDDRHDLVVLVPALRPPPLGPPHVRQAFGPARHAAVTARAGGALALAALLLFALALRLWGIHYGLPWLFYFHDEPQVVLRALRFGTGDLNPHFFIWPGTLLLWLAFLAYGGLFAFGTLAGWWHGASAFGAA